MSIRKGTPKGNTSRKIKHTVNGMSLKQRSESLGLKYTKVSNRVARKGKEEAIPFFLNELGIKFTPIKKDS